METKPYQRVWLEEAAPGETFIYKEGKAEREDVQNADIILGNVSPKLISTGDKLKWLQTNSAGVDGYIHGCLPKETVLTNATGAYGLAISEYMVAVWLELLKKLHLYRDVQRTGKWCDLGQVRSAWNSTVLVLGLGDIGGEFAKRAKALGARVIGVRRLLVVGLSDVILFSKPVPTAVFITIILLCAYFKAQSDQCLLEK